MATRVENWFVGDIVGAGHCDELTSRATQGRIEVGGQLQGGNACATWRLGSGRLWKNVHLEIGCRCGKLTWQCPCRGRGASSRTLFANLGRHSREKEVATSSSALSATYTLSAQRGECHHRPAVPGSAILFPRGVFWGTRWRLSLVFETTRVGKGRIAVFRPENSAAQESNERHLYASRHQNAATLAQMPSFPMVDPRVAKTTEDLPVKQWVLKLARHLFAVGFGILLGLAVSSRKHSLTNKYGYHLTPPVHAATAEVQISYNAPQLEWIKKKASPQDRAFYAVDSFFSTRPEGKAVAFAAIVIVTVLTGGVAYSQASKSDGEEVGFPESFWAAWAYIADSSLHLGERTLKRRIVALPLTVVGLLFFALLVSLMSESIENKVESLRRDGGVALEDNHTLIIGWTPKTIKLVKQLSLANKSRRHKRAVVILGEAQKQDMDNELLRAIPMKERGGSKIVTREGLPMVLENLRKCSAHDAQSIIVLSPGNSLEADEKDAQVLQTCLVLAYVPDLKADIVAEMAELDNIQVLKSMAEKLVVPAAEKLKLLAEQSTTPEQRGLALASRRASSTRKRKMVPIQAGDISSRMMIERALQPGLTATLMELFNFDGCEFRFKEWPELVGRTYGQAVFMFKDAIPCGLRVQTPTAPGCHVRINPPANTVIKPGDKILFVSKDEDSYHLDGPHRATSFEALDHKQPVPGLQNRRQKKPIRVLISGWKNDISNILTVLDTSLEKGSEVTMLSEVPADARQEELDTAPSFENIKIVHAFGNPLSRKVLEGLPVETYDKVMILLNENLDSENKSSDTSTTTTAMYIRHIQVDRGRKDSTIIAELVNSDSDALAEVQRTWLDDEIDAELVQSMILAHLAEDSDVGAVLDEIVSEKGSMLKLRKANSLIGDGEEIDFWELQARALRNGEVVVSIKCKDAGGKWEVNPINKDKKLKWNMNKDEFVVLTRGL